MNAITLAAIAACPDPIWELDEEGSSSAYNVQTLCCLSGVRWLANGGHVCTECGLQSEIVCAKAPIEYLATDEHSHLSEPFTTWEEAESYAERMYDHGWKAVVTTEVADPDNPTERVARRIIKNAAQPHRDYYKQHGDNSLSSMMAADASAGFMALSGAIEFLKEHKLLDTFLKTLPKPWTEFESAAPIHSLGNKAAA